MQILIFGDIVGKPGRFGLSQILPQWKAQHNPDLILTNVENLAHGKGVTPKTLGELDLLGVHAYTSGNHVLDQKEASRLCFEQWANLIRPANYMGGWPGRGWTRIQGRNKELRIQGNTNTLSSVKGTAGKQDIKITHNQNNFLIINLNGKVFFDEAKFGGIKNPFWAADEIINSVAKKDDIILVDFHAEATSEKAALGHYLDGRATFVYGTHQHVPTGDARILPKGTGFITDIGMTGPLNSVIGADTDTALKSYLDPEIKFKMVVPENSPVIVRAILATFDNNKIIRLERLEEIVS